MGLGGDDGSVATGNAGHHYTSFFDDDDEDGGDDDDGDDDEDDGDGDDDQLIMISISILVDSASGNTGRSLETYFPFL